LLTFWGGLEHGFNSFDHDPEDYAKNIHVPVLLQWGKQDARVTEAETIAIFKNLSAKNKKLVVYNDSGHQSLFKKEPEKWRGEVSQFLLNQ
jgi:alpha-beta hydrolase superfamily lysophospholipase